MAKYVLFCGNVCLNPAFYLRAGQERCKTASGRMDEYAKILTIVFRKEVLFSLLLWAFFLVGLRQIDKIRTKYDEIPDAH